MTAVEKLDLVEQASEPLRKLGYTDIDVSADDIRFVTARTEWRTDGDGVDTRDTIHIDGILEMIGRTVSRRYKPNCVSVSGKADMLFPGKERAACEEYLRIVTRGILAKQRHGYDERNTGSEVS